MGGVLYDCKGGNGERGWEVRGRDGWKEGTGDGMSSLLLSFEYVLGSLVAGSGIVVRVLHRLSFLLFLVNPF